MTKVLMVCLGNICRSPLAEGVLRKKLKENELHDSVDSAGTADYHVGEHPDKRSIANAKKHGIDISNLVGRQFTHQDFIDFDLIFAMDNSNLQNILALAQIEEEKLKVDLILNLASPERNLDVPDPYFGGKQGFENVYHMIDEACEELINRLKTDELN